MSDAEAWELFDEDAKRFLGLSGEEFLRAWDAGASLLEALGAKRSAHLPTGTIRLADFVELLLRDFNAKAQREDWRTILEESDV